jgi:hypothetical protein
MHHSHDADEDGRQQVDGDRTGPARNEIAGVAEHCLGRSQRHEASLWHLGLAENLGGRIRQRLRLRGHGCADGIHHLILTAGEIG